MLNSIGNNSLPVFNLGMQGRGANSLGRNFLHILDRMKDGGEGIQGKYWDKKPLPQEHSQSKQKEG